MPSFDVVSRVDMQEVNNAIGQVKKEIATRYDFKASKCSVDISDETITLLADNKMLLGALVQILNEKMSKRGVGVRSLDYKDPEQASGGALRQLVLIKQGLETEDCKKICKVIKEHGAERQSVKKVQTQIQKDQVRVIGPKKDVLQDIMALLRKDIALELQFVNFKD